MKPLPVEDLEHVLRYTGPLWEEARGRRILLSGATGFLGTWLLESLARCNNALDLKIDVAVLSRDPESFVRRTPHLASASFMRMLKGDVRDFAYPPGRFDFIVHGAASTSAIAACRPAELLSTVVDGTRHMLNFARGAGVSRLVFISSGAVYGPQPAHLSHIPESYLGGPDWLDPNSAYAEGKRVAEQMCAIAARESDIGFAIARCFAFVGPLLPLDQHFAIGNFIGDALAGRNIRVRGDGTPMRSYLYAADLAIWLWTMLLHKPPADRRLEVFNVGSGQAISIRDLAQMVVDEVNPSLQVEIAGKPAAGAPRLQYVPDVAKAEARLGLRELIGLRDAIRRTAAWHR
jgi:nucleoside-diphosphate-sugar epimerase